VADYKSKSAYRHQVHSKVAFMFAVTEIMERCWDLGGWLSASEWIFSESLLRYI